MIFVWILLALAVGALAVAAFLYYKRISRTLDTVETEISQTGDAVQGVLNNPIGAAINGLF